MQLIPFCYVCTWVLMQSILCVHTKCFLVIPFRADEPKLVVVRVVCVSSLTYNFYSFQMHIIFQFICIFNALPIFSHSLTSYSIFTHLCSVLVDIIIWLILDHLLRVHNANDIWKTCFIYYFWLLLLNDLTSIEIFSWTNMICLILKCTPSWYPKPFYLFCISTQDF